MDDDELYSQRSLHYRTQCLSISPIFRTTPRHTYTAICAFGDILLIMDIQGYPLFIVNTYSLDIFSFYPQTFISLFFVFL